MLNAIEIVANALTAKQIREVRNQARANGNLKLAVVCGWASDKPKDSDDISDFAFRLSVKRHAQAREAVAAYILNGTLPT